MATKVVVVTGSNKGIGFAIVRSLCKKFDGAVYLTSRDVERGKKAVQELEKEGLKPCYHQLDITDVKSIETLRDYMKKNYGGIDALVNNAAIAFKGNAPEPAGVQAEETMRINYYALLTTCNILFPVVKNGGRVVNVSSSAGHLSRIPNEKIRAQLADPNLTLECIDEITKQFLEAAKKGTHVEDFGSSCYSVSKVMVSALTRVQQRLLNDRDIKVNSVHPGYVDTDMTSHLGTLTIDEGAVAPVYLVVDAPDSIKGQYVWKDCTVVDWNSEAPPAIY